MAFLELPFHPLATKASAFSFVTPYFDVGDFRIMEVLLEVLSGYGESATMDVSLAHSLDLNHWYALAGFTTVTVLPGPGGLVNPSSEKLTASSFLRYVRAGVVIQAAAIEPVIFTFSLIGVARDWH